MQKLIFLILLAYATLAHPQPDTVWTKTLGGNATDIAFSVQETSDLGFILCGYTRSFGNGNTDIWLVKTDGNGDTSWTRTFGSGGDEFGYRVREVFGGGYIVAGSRDNGFDDAWLIRTDADGDTVWTKTYGRGNNDIAYSVVQTFDTGFIVTGKTTFFADDVWLLKTTSDGDTAWSKTFGRFGNDVGYDVIQTGDQGFLLTGATGSYGAGDDDLWLIKTGTNGDTMWTRTYGGFLSDEGLAVQQTLDGGYIIAGYTRSFGSGETDAWLLKTDSSGDTAWTKTFGGAEYDIATAVQQTEDGGYIAGGYTYSFGAANGDVWVIRTNNLGDTLWTKTIGGVAGDLANDLQLTADGGYILAGSTMSFGGMIYEDAWLLRLYPEDVDALPSGDFARPVSYRLRQNYPNPFNPLTTISFYLPVSVPVRLTVYNMIGQKVATLTDGTLPAGNHEVQWNASGFASGVYFYRLEAPGFSKMSKMIVLK